MKKFPELNNDFGDIHKMLIDRIRGKLLLTAIELKVFNHLTEPKSAEDIAKAISGHPGNTRHFLDGLTSIGLLTKKDGRYENSELSKTFLVDGHDTSLGDFLTGYNVYFVPVLEKMKGLVLEGPMPLPQMGAESEEMRTQMTVSMANCERSGMGQMVAKIVSQLPEFPSFGKMLDMGGGPGLLGIAITMKHPSMKGIIFDRPPVVKIAKDFIAEYGMEDRMDVIGGDFMKDSIGEGYDLIWVCAALYFSKDDIDSITKKIYDALNPGGVFISFHDGLTEEWTKPEFMVLAWLPTSMTGYDFPMEQGFIADSMLRVGFKSVRSRTYDTPMGPMDMDVARK